MLFSKFIRIAAESSGVDPSYIDMYTRFVNPGGDLFEKVKSQCEFAFKPMHMPKYSETVTAIDDLYSRQDYFLYNELLVDRFISAVLSNHFYELVSIIAEKSTDESGKIKYIIEDNMDLVRAGVALVKKYLSKINPATVKIQNLIDPTNPNHYAPSKDRKVITLLENISRSEYDIVDANYGATMRSLGKVDVEKLYGMRTLKELIEYYLDVVGTPTQVALEMILDKPHSLFTFAPSKIGRQKAIRVNYFYNVPILKAIHTAIPNLKNLGKILSVAIFNYGLHIFNLPIMKNLDIPLEQVTKENFWEKIKIPRYKEIFLNEFKDYDFQKFLWGGIKFWYSDKGERQRRGEPVFYKDEDGGWTEKEIVDESAQKKMEEVIQESWLAEMISVLWNSTNKMSYRNQLISAVTTALDSKILKQVENWADSILAKRLYDILLNLSNETLLELFLRLGGEAERAKMTKSENRKLVIDYIFRSISLKLRGNIVNVVNEIKNKITNISQPTGTTLEIISDEAERIISDVISKSVVGVLSPSQIRKEIVSPLLAGWKVAVIEAINVSPLIDILLKESSEVGKILRKQMVPKRRLEILTDQIRRVLSVIGLPIPSGLSKIIDQKLSKI